MLPAVQESLPEAEEGNEAEEEVDEKHGEEVSRTVCVGPACRRPTTLYLFATFHRYVRKYF